MPSSSVTTSASQIVPPGPRRGLILQNLSDTDIYISNLPGVTVVDGENAGLKVAANGGLLSTGASAQCRDPLYAIHAATGTKQIRYLEF